MSNRDGLVIRLAILILLSVSPETVFASDSLPSTRVASFDLAPFGYEKNPTLHGTAELYNNTELHFTSDTRLLVAILSTPPDAPHPHSGQLLEFDIPSSHLVRSTARDMNESPDRYVYYNQQNLPRAAADSDNFTLTGNAKSGLVAKSAAGKSLFSIDRHALPGFQWDSHAVASSGGRIFGLSWSNNSRVQLLDPLACIDECVPPAIQHFVVLDSSTGKTVASLQWDPRPWNDEVIPAISPDGTLIAIVRRGSVEVYKLDPGH